MLNLMVTFILYALDVKYPFWASLVQKIKIVYLSVNLVPSLIEFDSMEFVSHELKLPFPGKCSPKNQKYLFVKFGNSNPSQNMLISVYEI